MRQFVRRADYTAKLFFRFYLFFKVTVFHSSFHSYCMRILKIPFLYMKYYIFILKTEKSVYLNEVEVL